MNELYDFFDDGTFYYNTTSEALRGFRYNRRAEVLEVCFEHNSTRMNRNDDELMLEIYRFSPVPENVFDSLIDENKWRVIMYERGIDIVDRYSIGTAFNALINYNDCYDYMSYRVPVRQIQFIDYYTGD